MKLLARLGSSFIKTLGCDDDEFYNRLAGIF